MRLPHPGHAWKGPGLTRKQRTRIAIAAVATAIGAAAILWPQGPVSRISAKLGTIAQARTEPGWPVYVTTVAGGAAGFADPFGLAMDSAGNLYVADAGDNNRIRKVARDGGVTHAGRRSAKALPTASAPRPRFHTPSAHGARRRRQPVRGRHRQPRDPQGHAAGVVTHAGRQRHAGLPRRQGRAGAVQRPGRRGGRQGRQCATWPTPTTTASAASRPTAWCSTVAGGGVPGDLDGPAPAARFDTPSALVVDARRRRCCVADTQNGAIRKVAPDGQVGDAGARAAGRRRRRCCGGRSAWR